MHADPNFKASQPAEVYAMKISLAAAPVTKCQHTFIHVRLAVRSPYRLYVVAKCSRCDMLLPIPLPPDPSRTQSDFRQN